MEEGKQNRVVAFVGRTARGSRRVFFIDRLNQADWERDVIDTFTSDEDHEYSVAATQHRLDTLRGASIGIDTTEHLAMLEAGLEFLREWKVIFAADDESYREAERARVRSQQIDAAAGKAGLRLYLAIAEDE